MMMMMIRVLVGRCKNVKEVDLYSAFIVVPHTQGAQVRTGLKVGPGLPGRRPGTDLFAGSIPGRLFLQL